MRFFLDHDVPERVAGVLKKAGHFAVKLRDVLDVETPDAKILDYARKHKLILLSCNRDDFLSLAKQRSHLGIIILIRRKSRIAECSSLLRLLERAGKTGLEDNFNFA